MLVQSKRMTSQAHPAIGRCRTRFLVLEERPCHLAGELFGLVNVEAVGSPIRMSHVLCLLRPGYSHCMLCRKQAITQMAQPTFGATLPLQSAKRLITGRYRQRCQ